MISIICLTYNHHKYIKAALDSFISQKTIYPFEVLIHDDASTDGTTEIIKEYERKYPNIIKPVYEEKNQYGKKNMTMSLIDIAAGKYFAFCEGDDYWCDDNKIQKQIDYMEANPDCSLCIHNSKQVNELGDHLKDIVVTTCDRVIPTDEVIIKDGGFCATNSIIGRLTDAKNSPAFLRECGFDYTWQIYLAACGSTYCFSDYMSVYRNSVSGSWSSRMGKDPVMNGKVRLRICNMLESYNAWSDYKYTEVVKERIYSNTFWAAIKINDSSLITDDLVICWLKKQSFSIRFRYLLWKCFPGIYYWVRAIKIRIIYG